MYNCRPVFFNIGYIFTDCSFNVNIDQYKKNCYCFDNKTFQLQISKYSKYKLKMN